jgi:Ca2+-binding RTX toxin-like protein
VTLATLIFRGYNTRVQHRVRRGLIALAAVLVAAVPLSAQGGTFSGANGPIAYTCGANVCVVNPDGSNPHAFIANASDLTWSSDESEIVYVTGTVLTVADDDGSFPAALPNTGTAATQPSLSFNGNLAAYSKDGDIFTISTSTLSGGDDMTNTPSTAESDPAYSPDGTQIAYVANGQVNILGNLTTSRTTHAVTTTAVAAHDPSWSPDGSKIVYADGGQIRTIVSSAVSGEGTTIGTGSQPVFSPDGTKIVFVNTGGHLAIMSSTGASPAEIPGAITGTQPDWKEITITAPGAPPTNVSYPTITPTLGDTQPVLGHFVTAGIGSWTGEFPISYKFQWKRCTAADPVNGPCADIPEATSSFYKPSEDDVGKRLRVAVTATNREGSASQNSEVSEVVIALAPHNRDTPELFGGNTVDSPITVEGGTWDGSTPITFTYSWRICNPQGDPETCVQIPGATDDTFTPTADDIGRAIRVWVTGTNVAGSDVVVTNHTFPIVDKAHFAPSASISPLVGGTPGIGRQLTANIGEYDGDAPIKTQFSWQRCDATGEACHVIAKAKKVVYFPTPADVGYTLRIAVVATNTYGDTTELSTPTEPIAALPPHVKGRHIVGTKRGEYLAGGGHDDIVEGRGGNDTLLGGAGDDRIEGGSGNDVITGGSGADRLFGGKGSDTIYAADGERDTIDCGAGRDRVVADDVDKTVGCEVVAGAPSSSSSPSPEPGSG